MSGKYLALDIGNVCVKLHPERCFGALGFRSIGEVPFPLLEAIQPQGKLPGIGRDQLRRRRRGGCPEVGGKIGNGKINFVAHGGHHRHPGSFLSGYLCGQCVARGRSVRAG